MRCTMQASSNAIPIDTAIEPGFRRTAYQRPRFRQPKEKDSEAGGDAPDAHAVAEFDFQEEADPAAEQQQDMNKLRKGRFFVNLVSQGLIASRITDRPSKRATSKPVCFV